MDRSPAYYNNGIMHHPERQGVSASSFVIKITPHCWKLIFAVWDDNELVGAGSGDWQGDRIIPFLALSHNHGFNCILASHWANPGQRCAKWILADLWVWVTTLQLKYCQQGRGHNGEWKWIVAIRSNCSIHWNYRHSLQLHGGLKVGASNFLRITIPVCSRSCYW